MQKTGLAISMKKADAEIARAIFVECLVAQRSDDPDVDNYFISLDEDFFRAKLKAVLPDARIKEVPINS
jgi:hypothetical protein